MPISNDGETVCIYVSMNVCDKLTVRTGATPSAIMMNVKLHSTTHSGRAHPTTPFVGMWRRHFPIAIHDALYVYMRLLVQTLCGVRMRRVLCKRESLTHTHTNTEGDTIPKTHIVPRSAFATVQSNWYTKESHNDDRNVHIFVRHEKWVGPLFLVGMLQLRSYTNNIIQSCVSIYIRVV